MELRESAYLDQIEWFKVLNDAINLHIGYHKGEENPDVAVKTLESHSNLLDERYKLAARMSLYASDEAAVLFDGLNQLITTWMDHLKDNDKRKVKSLETMGLAIFEFERELIDRVRREMGGFNAVAIGRRRIRLTRFRRGTPPDQALLVLQDVLKRVDEQLGKKPPNGGEADK